MHFRISNRNYVFSAISIPMFTVKIVYCSALLYLSLGKLKLLNKDFRPDE